jgi:thioredoxin reductase (NADPH)
MKVETTVIIGAGPAGLAAAIQLLRYGIEPLVLERDSIGGLLRNANLVENYPGFPDGVPGMELVRLFEKQASKAGVRVVFDEVNGLTNDGQFFRIETGNGTIVAGTVVIATGTAPRQLPDLEVPDAIKDRLYYEVYPLYQVSGQIIAIVGAGDAAFDYALNLAKQNRVVILNRGDQRKCLPLLWERASANPRINYLENAALSRISLSSGNKLQVEYNRPDGGSILHVDYLVGAIGRDPALDFIAVEFEERVQDCIAEERLFMVGDVTKGIYRQTAIAVGEGVLTAMRIYWNKKETI